MNKLTDLTNDKYFKKLFFITTLASFLFFILAVTRHYLLQSNAYDLGLFDQWIWLTGRFMRGLISWIGFNQISVRYVRDPRFAGATKYSLKKMLSFAIEGLTNFSRKPLRLATFTGFLFSLFSFFGIAY